MLGRRKFRCLSRDWGAGEEHGSDSQGDRERGAERKEQKISGSCRIVCFREYMFGCRGDPSAMLSIALQLFTFMSHSNPQ